MENNYVRYLVCVVYVLHIDRSDLNHTQYVSSSFKEEDGPTG